MKEAPEKLYFSGAVLNLKLCDFLVSAPFLAPIGVVWCKEVNSFGLESPETSINTGFFRLLLVIGLREHIGDMNTVDKLIALIKIDAVFYFVSVKYAHGVCLDLFFLCHIETLLCFFLNLIKVGVYVEYHFFCKGFARHHKQTLEGERFSGVNKIFIDFNA